MGNRSSQSTAASRKRTPFQLELRDKERLALEGMAEREQRSMSAQLRLLILRADEAERELGKAAA